MIYANKNAEFQHFFKNFSYSLGIISGMQVPTSAGGGGSNPDSDLRWDGRNPGEEEEAYHRRCLVYAIAVVGRGAQSKGRKR